MLPLKVNVLYRYTKISVSVSITIALSALLLASDDTVYALQFEAHFSSLDNFIKGFSRRVNAANFTFVLAQEMTHARCPDWTPYNSVERIGL